MADWASPAKKQKLDTAGLPVCPYGASCYRKNPQHFKEYSHSCSTVRSGSCSFGSSSSAGVDKASAGTAAKPATGGSTSAQLPPCWYGVSCYRKNLLHFAEFSHPTSHTSLAASDGGKKPTEQVSQKADIFSKDLSLGKRFSKLTDKERKDLIKRAFAEKITPHQELEKAKKIVQDKSREVELLQKQKPTDKVSKKADILSKDLSLVKRYSKLTDEERIDLIKRAHEEKMKLQQELEKAKKIVQDKSRELELLQSQMNTGLLMLEGEEEALKKTKTTYFPLLPERVYKAGSASQIHFRLAESQFYRLMTGDCAKKTRVTKVEYVVSPQVVHRFREYQKKLKKRSEDLSYPVLGFHGTTEANIKPICEQGFKTPGDPHFKMKTDAGYYGAGVYFSEFPSYSMGYIQGGSKLMLCQVLPGKVYECKSLITGAALMKGYDSHMSPCKKELVIFNSAAILPCYIIYFKEAKADFTYTTPGSKVKKHVSNDVATTAGSKIFEGMTFALTGKLSDTQANLFDLIELHGGSKGTKSNFDILIVPDNTTDHSSEKVQQAMKKSVPIVYESYIFDCIDYNLKLPIIDYDIDEDY